MLMRRGRSPPDAYPWNRSATALCCEVRTYFRQSADTSHESNRP